VAIWEPVELAGPNCGWVVAVPSGEVSETAVIGAGLRLLNTATEDGRMGS